MPKVARKNCFFTPFYCMALCIFFCHIACGQTITVDPTLHPTEVSAFLPTVSLSPFHATARYDTQHRIIIDFTVPSGYYLYREKITIDVPLPLRLKTVHFPKGVLQHDIQQGESVVYPADFSILCTLQGTQYKPFTLRVHAQGCAKTGICYPPQVYQFSNLSNASPRRVITARLINEAAIDPSIATPLDTPKKEPNNINTYASRFQQHSWPLLLLGFFGIGILLSLTPCVFPLIPIILSCVLRSTQPLSWKKTAQLSCGYVVSMALTYSLVGAVAGATGTLLSVWLQTPPALIGLAILLVLLSFAMLGVFTFQAPLAMQNLANRLSQRYQNGQFWSTCAMGALSALMVGPCVASPLAGILLYVGQTGNIVLGWSALLLMGLGMGCPLLVIANFTGKLLPPFGNNLNVVKHILGIVLLGLALHTVQPLVSLHLLLWGYGMLAIGASVLLATFEPLPAHTAMGARLSKCVGLILLVVGSSTIVTVLYHTLWHSLQTQDCVVSQKGAARVVAVAHNLAQLRSLITRSTKPCLVEFYATWCNACHDFENETLTHPDIVEALKNWQLIRVNISRHDGTTQEFLHHFSLFGPPALLFFASHQPNQETYRHIGFMSSDDLLPVLSTAQ